MSSILVPAFPCPMRGQLPAPLDMSVVLLRQGNATTQGANVVRQPGSTSAARAPRQFTARSRSVRLPTVRFEINSMGTTTQGYSLCKHKPKPPPLQWFDNPVAVF